jgi:cobalamin biosynthesis protein CobD/CbiB
MTYFVPAIANVAPDLIKKERSGNPNPVGRQKQPAEQTNKNQRSSKRKKRKKGCLWWVVMIIVAWITFKVIAAFIS